MRRTRVTIVKSILCGAAILSCLVALPASGQIEIVVRPPFWFVASARPVYFEGRATYWYGNRWYYRDGGSWRYYNNEPTYLRNHRGSDQRNRHHYWRGHGRGPHRR